MQTLQCCLSASFFKAGCKVVSLSLMAFPPDLFMSRRLRYLLRVVLVRKFAQQSTSWEATVIIASLFPIVLENALHFILKFDHPCV